MTQEELKRMLLAAAERGDVEKLKSLFRRGGKKGTRDVFGNTLLHLAAVNGRRGAAAFLISGGAEVDATNSCKNQPLHFAACSGCVGVVSLLIAKGAMVEAPGENGARALHVAAEKGDLKMVRHLIEKQGAVVDARSDDGTQPLHVAVYRSRLSVVKYLVEKAEADAEAKDNGGVTALGLSMNNPQIREFLKEWNLHGNAEKRRQAALAALLARQRQLGSLRPRGPSL